MAFSVALFRPQDNIGPAVPLRFVATSDDNKPQTIVCEFSFNGGAYQPATPAVDSDVMTLAGAPVPVPAPAVGADYRFVWDARADLGASAHGTAKLRLTPSCSGQIGTPVETDPFQLDTSLNFKAAELAPHTSPTVRLVKLFPVDKVSGISGLMLPTSFQVVAVDDQNDAVVGARISFSVVPDAGVTGPLAVVDDAPFITSTLATTDEQGRASACVRALPDATGTGVLKASIVGIAPDTPWANPVAVDFPISVAKPRILTALATNSPFMQLPTELHVGEQYVLEVGLAGDGDGSSFDFIPDPTRPVELKIEGSNVVLSHEVVRIPSSIATATGGQYRNSTGRPSTLVAFTASTFEGTANITISCPASPIFSQPPGPVTITIPINKSTMVKRYRSDLTTDPVYLRAIWTRGYEPTGLPQVGFPGLTLAEPFAVSLVDDQGNSYDEAATAGSWDYGSPPPETPISVSLSCSSGTLSTSPGPGTSGQIVVQMAPSAGPGSTLSQPGVYFTPSGPGPWYVTATFFEDLADPLANPIPTQMPDGTTQNRVLSLAIGNINHVFLIEEPSQVSLEAAASTQEIGDPAVGDLIRLKIEGLSGTVAGTADAVRLQTLGAGVFGSAVTLVPLQFTSAYTGLNYPYDQPLNFETPSQGVLKSKPFMLIGASSPEIATPPPQGQMAPPGALLRILHANQCVDYGARVASTPLLRSVVAGQEAMQEAISGTTPAEGCEGSVILANGEFLYSICDLEFETRSGPVRLSRTYRSQVITDGPLGPGWTLELGERLDVTFAGALRWRRGSGRFDDIIDFVPGKGLFVSVSTNSAIDADNGAFLIADPHGVVSHFDVDGSLMLTKDRWGSVTRFTYNEKGQLIRLTDPHGRKTEFLYWQEGDPVAPEIVGRLRQVTDFTGRFIEYEYYEAADPGGEPGWLKKIYLPAADTLPSGGAPGTTPSVQQPGFRRTETYVYAGGLLTQVLNSDGNTWFVNDYDGDCRVKSQQYGGGSFGFAYGGSDFAQDFSGSRTTTVVDAMQQTSRYTFAPSPWPNAAVPVQVQDETLSKTVYEINPDGLFVKETTPEGIVTTFVYDDGINTSPTYGRAQDARQHGNLLAARLAPPAGDPKIWTFEYDFDASLARNRYNEVRRSVGPRGNAPGVNSEVYATHYLYDWEVSAQMQVDTPELTAGDHGDLVRIQGPRTMHMVVGEPAGVARGIWVEDKVLEVRKHNAVGQVVWSMDPHGVVTEYAYYPSTTPDQGVPSAAGGGFLGTAARDTTDTPRRHTYVPDIPPAPMKLTWSYDPLGHITKIVDNSGKEISIDSNDLHEIKRVSWSTGSPSPGSNQPASAARSFGHNIFGMLAQEVIEQPGAPTGAGGSSPYHELAVDPSGRVSDIWSTFAEGHQAHERFTYDPNDREAAYLSPDVLDGLAVKEGVGYTRDVAGNQKTVATGFDAASSPASGSLSASATWTRFGEPLSLTEPGASKSRDFRQDGFGNTDAAVDALGNVHRVWRDLGGEMTRTLRQRGEGASNQQDRATAPSADAAPVTSFSELRLDEYGRRRRLHRGAFRPAAPGAAGSPAPPVPDYIYMSPDPVWPPAVGVLQNDGAWGPGDGRSTTDVAYDGFGLPTRIVTDDLHQTLIRRDAFGRPIGLTEWSVGASPPLIRTISNTYDSSSGRLTDLKVTDAPTLNAMAAPITFAAALTLPRKYELDDMGRVTRTIDGDGGTLRAEYDQIGHLEVVFDASGPPSPAETFNGHPVNLDGCATRFDRDAFGRTTGVNLTLAPVPDASGNALDTTANPSGKVGFKLSFSAAGRITSFTGQDQQPVAIAYDNLGRPESVTYPPSLAGAVPTAPVVSISAGGGAPPAAPPVPDATTHTCEYDPQSGHLSATVDARGVRIEYQYDDLGRTLGVTVNTPNVPGSEGVDYVYDGDSVTLTDRTGGRTLRLSYDSLGRLLAEEAGGLTVGSEYQGDGPRNILLYPGSQPLQSASIFDGAERLVSVDYGGSTIARFEHIGIRRIANRIQPPIQTTYTYGSAAGHLTAMRIDGLNNIGPILYDLKRDRLGRVIERTRTLGGVAETKAWTYDSAGRLAIETSSPKLRSPDSTATTRYFDGDGVILKDTVAVGAAPTSTHLRTREERGRILTVDGAAWTWDANGNLLSDGRRAFSYDAWNRLITVTLPDGSEFVFNYDPMNRLISRTVTAHGGASETETYVYDGWELLEVRSAGAGGQDTVVERYVYGDQLDDILRVEIGGQALTLLQGPEGWIEGLVDSQHNLIELYDYMLTGAPIVLGADGKAKSGGPASRFLFQRRPYDARAGLYYYRMRWYAPDLGVFLTPDPSGIAAGANAYGLNHGDPVNYRDPHGCDDEDSVGGVILTGGKRFLGGAAGAGCAVVSGIFGFFRSGIADPVLAVCGNKAASQRIHQGQDYLADFFFEVGQGRAGKWIADGYDQRVNAWNRADMEGRHLSAAFSFGGEAMNVYMAGRTILSTGAGGLRAAAALRQGLRPALGAVLRWGTTYRGVGIPPSLVRSARNLALSAALRFGRVPELGVAEPVPTVRFVDPYDVAVRAAYELNFQEVRFQALRRISPRGARVNVRTRWGEFESQRQFNDVQVVTGAVDRFLGKTAAGIPGRIVDAAELPPEIRGRLPTTNIRPSRPVFNCGENLAARQLIGRGSRAENLRFASVYRRRRGVPDPFRLPGARWPMCGNCEEIYPMGGDWPH